LGDDWPPFFPLNLEWEVEMVVEESVHYAPDPMAEDEWWSERGVGFDGAGRIGANNRTFAVSLYHQEHCLLYLYRQLTNRTTKSQVPHYQHCLNYLREQALCHPDLTLEPGDFVTRNFEVDRVGQVHTCRDFETAWDYNTKSWLDWYHFLKETRLPSKSLYHHLIRRPLNNGFSDTWPQV
jgi:hypothetical protein